MAMFHYGKTPQGDLEISVSGEDVGLVHSLLTGRALDFPELYDFKNYIESNFKEELGEKDPVSIEPCNDY